MPPEILVEKCLLYFLKHGIANLSLRPLAAEIGTSARMLVHHFGSKQHLIATVMGRVRDRLQQILNDLCTGTKPGTPAVMLEFWKQITTNENRPYLRLLLEVQVLAIANPRPYRAYLAATSSTWLDVIEDALGPGRNRRTTATLCTAVIDGLLLELFSTGDLRRTSRALRVFTASIKGLQTA